MQSNKLRMAIRATAAMAVLSVAGQANAVSLNVGDDVEASLYGYARLNMSYDLNADRANSTRAGSFTGGNEDIEGHFGADVQQSRLGVKVKHSSGVMVNIEGDFRGSGSGPGSLRMRHAYGTYKGFLAGRTWSNYLSFVGNTPTLDFDSLTGTAGSQDRSEQIRTPLAPCPSLSKILVRKQLLTEPAAYLHQHSPLGLKIPWTPFHIRQQLWQARLHRMTA